MSGGGGGRSDVGSGSGSPDECGSLDVETPLNSPNPDVLKHLKKGDILDVAVVQTSNNRKSLVAKNGNDQTAGSLTPPSLVTIVSCIEKGFQYGAKLLDTPSGGSVRVRIQPKT